MTREPTFDQAALEAGRRLFAHEARFELGVREAAQLPPDRFPEVAFAGRSNVGKSSLLNALLGRRDLARTSNTPGRTREVNFFSLADRLMLVDLPGYGYARAAKTEINRWNRLIRDYLRGRAGLRRVCLLIDSRRGPRESDEAVMTLLGEAAVNFQAVLTKADKVKSAELRQMLERTEAALRAYPAGHPEILVTSSEKGHGLPELRAALSALADPPPQQV